MNLGGLRRRALNRMGIPMGDSFYSHDVVADAVNQALQTINEEQHWPWTEALASLPTVAGSPVVLLPDDWAAMKQVYCNGAELIELSITDWATGNTPTQVGTPYAWSVSVQELLLRPAPSGVMDVQIIYYRGETELVADTDEPLLPDRYQAAVVSKAAELLSARQDDSRARAGHLADYVGWLNRMRRSTRSTTRPTVPRIRPGSWYE